MLVYFLFAACGIGLIAGLLTLAWRWMGNLLLVPLGGAVIGSLFAVAVALFELRTVEPANTGVQGGGDATAAAIVGFLIGAAVMGAVIGGLLASLLAGIVWAGRKWHRSTRRPVLDTSIERRLSNARGPADTPTSAQ